MSGYGSIETEGLTLQVSSENIQESIEKKPEDKLNEIIPHWKRSKVTILLSIFLTVAVFVGFRSFRDIDNIEFTSLAGGFPVPGPPPIESDLTDDQKEKLEDGTKAIAEVEKEVIKFSNNDPSPAGLLSFLTEATNLVAIFVPQFAVIGQALAICNLFASDDSDKQDRNVKVMLERFSALEGKLKKLLEELKGFDLKLCKQSLEEATIKHIDNFANNLRMMSDENGKVSHRKIAQQSMRRACEIQSEMPQNLIFRYEKIVSKKNDELQCYNAMLSDSKNRVGYFRRQYMAPVIKKMIEAAELQGICYGLLGTETYSKLELQSGDCGGLNPINCAMKNVGDVFKETVKKMYEKPRDVLAGLKDDYQFHGVEDAYLKMKKDFYPDFLYGVLKVTMTKGVKPGDEIIGEFGEGSERYGSVHHGQYLIIWRNYKGKLPALSWMYHNIYNCRQMCTSGGSKCYKENCDSSSHLINHYVKKHSPFADTFFRERGVITVRLQTRKRTVCGHNAGWIKGSWQVVTTGYVDEYDPDSIIETFHKHEEYQGSAYGRCWDERDSIWGFYGVRSEIQG